LKQPDRKVNFPLYSQL